jgi:uncharacterized membrane protein YbjE (DUF340 family)
VWEQVLISTAGPPIIAVLWRLRARGWARTVQGGTVSEKTERRQKKEFWILLVVLYAIVIGVFIYSAWKCSQTG